MNQIQLTFGEWVVVWVLVNGRHFALELDLGGTAVCRVNEHDRDGAEADDAVRQLILGNDDLLHCTRRRI